jgi:hypothetical protein
MDPQSAVMQNGQDMPVQDSSIHRRKFLLFSGAALATALVGVSCSTDLGDEDTGNSNEVNLGSGDTGVLNYAYALEQLEAAFYTQVMATPFSGMTAMESEYLKDIRDHEIAHREFFKNALMSNAIQNLEVDFSSINFTSRDSVLATAKAFEDLGVSAYNGAGKLLTNAANLLIAGKIVSVEARHAAVIRELINPGPGTAFANAEVVNAQGLDVVRTPLQVLEIASPFLKTRLNARNLPTS